MKMRYSTYRQNITRVGAARTPDAASLTARVFLLVSCDDAFWSSHFFTATRATNIKKM